MHLGIVCFSSPGHVNPMMSLARRLRERGHAITFFQLSDSTDTITDEGFQCIAIGNRIDFDHVKALETKIHRSMGIKGLKLTGRRMELEATVFLRSAATIEESKIDGLIVDQFEVFGGTLAERVRLPYVTVIVAMPLSNAGETPIYFPWPHSSQLIARIRNTITHFILFLIAGRSVTRIILDQRKKWQLPPITKGGFFSRLAQISQLPQFLDYPRLVSPPLYYAGPFITNLDSDDARFSPQAFGNRPVIYVSLGTVSSNQPYIYRLIDEACAGFDVHLVVSTGKAKIEEIGKLKCRSTVMEHLSQLAVLRTARLAIFHAGVNTALECLYNGVPMIVIPLTNDQPGMAARLKRIGVAEIIPVRRLTVDRVRRCVNSILSDPGYAEAALAAKKQLEGKDGAMAAAEIIDKCLQHS
jgi:UDP:flavonoid glycosyltransferase YjiC (YdhE family)